MFRGPATLMRPNPNVKWVFGAGVAACLLFVAAVVVLPGAMKLIAAAVLVVMMLSIYPVALSGALTPREERVSIYVDQTGIYAGDAPFALREDITQAYIRPALRARTARHQSFGGSVPATFDVNLPKYPLTVELVTNKGQLNINPGGQDAAAAILTALGFPVTECAPDHVARTSPRQLIWMLLVVVLIVAAALGYSAYMAHRTLGR
jgi:hypothetical protein